MVVVTTTVLYVIKVNGFGQHPPQSETPAAILPQASIHGHITGVALSPGSRPPLPESLGMRLITGGSSKGGGGHLRGHVMAPLGATPDHLNTETAIPTMSVAPTNTHHYQVPL